MVRRRRFIRRLVWGATPRVSRPSPPRRLRGLDSDPLTFGYGLCPASIDLGFRWRDQMAWRVINLSLHLSSSEEREMHGGKGEEEEEEEGEGGRRKEEGGSEGGCRD